MNQNTIANELDVNHKETPKDLGKSSQGAQSYEDCLGPKENVKMEHHGYEKHKVARRYVKIEHQITRRLHRVSPTREDRSSILIEQNKHTKLI